MSWIQVKFSQKQELLQNNETLALFGAKMANENTYLFSRLH